MIVLRFTSDLEFTYLGKVDFNSAFEIQQNLWRMAKEKNQTSIMGLEHPAVVTLGRRAQEPHLPISLPVVRTTRGGLVTLHSEGQLIIYPIVNLKQQKIGVKDFVSELLSITQKTFADFQVQTFIDEERIGLYTAKGKIAFCGLEIKEGVSQHGLSVNISNDLSLFKNIVSCGISSMSTDRLQNYRSDVNLSLFFQAWIENWKTPEIGYEN